MNFLDWINANLECRSICYNKTIHGKILGEIFYRRGTICNDPSWSIWNHRNNTIHGEIFDEINSYVIKVVTLLEDFKWSKLALSLPINRSVVRWIKPPVVMHP